MNALVLYRCPIAGVSVPNTYSSVGTVHLGNKTANIFNEFPNTDRLTIGNFNEKDFWVYSACSVRAALQRETLTVRCNSLNSLNLNVR